jgi:hypothetical protein
MKPPVVNTTPYRYVTSGTGSCRTVLSSFRRRTGTQLPKQFFHPINKNARLLAASATFLFTFSNSSFIFSSFFPPDACPLVSSSTCFRHAVWCCCARVFFRLYCTVPELLCTVRLHQHFVKHQSTIIVMNNYHSPLLDDYDGQDVTSTEYRDRPLPHRYR